MWELFKLKSLININFFIHFSISLNLTFHFIKIVVAVKFVLKNFVQRIFVTNLVGNFFGYLNNKYQVEFFVAACLRYMITTRYIVAKNSLLSLHFFFKLFIPICCAIVSMSDYRCHSIYPIVDYTGMLPLSETQLLLMMLFTFNARYWTGMMHCSRT